VPRYIDESEPQQFSIRSWQLKMGESQINGYSAALFFLQAIGINSGQGFDQSGFTVINVASGANDDGLHRGQYIRTDSCARSPWEA
jgi:hypothetical protein